MLSTATELEPLRGAWDALADDCDRPTCASGWLLAWQRTHDAQARVVVVRDGSDVVGIAPFVATAGHAGVRRLGLMGAGTTTLLEPLAPRGRAVALEKIGELQPHATAGVLTSGRVQVDEVRLEGVPSGSPWPAALAQGWSPISRRLLTRGEEMGEPLVSLAPGNYEDWFSQRSSNFRSQLGGAERKLAKQDAVVRRSAPGDDLKGDIDAFVRLHHARWEGRGGSGIVTEPVEAMLREDGPELIAAGRLDVWSVDSGDGIVSSQIWLRGGGTTTMWLSGFDDAWARARVTMVTFAAVLRDAFAAGMHRVSLGGGEQPYKLRFADDSDRITWWSFPAPGARLPLVLGEEAFQ